MNWSIEIYTPKKGGARRKATSLDDKHMVKYAKLANASYDGQPIPSGWIVDDRYSNNDMKTLVNKKTKEVAYSIAGTRLDTKKNIKRDLLTDDVKIFLGQSGKIKRTKELKKLIKDSQNEYKDYDKKIVGHSLGSRIGKMISDDTGIEMIGYNTGSSPLQKLSDKISNILNKPLNKPEQTHYVVPSDIISSPWLLESEDIIEVPKTKDTSHTLSNFMGGCGDCKTGSGNSDIHSVLFDNTKWTTEQARQWLKKNKLKPIKRVHKTAENYRYRIIDPAEFKKFSTKKTDKGITLIIGYR